MGAGWYARACTWVWCVAQALKWCRCFSLQSSVRLSCLYGMPPPVRRSPMTHAPPCFALFPASMAILMCFIHVLCASRDVVLKHVFATLPLGPPFFFSVCLFVTPVCLAPVGACGCALATELSRAYRRLCLDAHTRTRVQTHNENDARREWRACLSASGLDVRRLSDTHAHTRRRTRAT